MIKQTKHEKKTTSKPVVFVTVACSYFIDPRVKQEVNTLTKNGFYAFVLSWDRERKYPDKQTNDYYIKSAKLLEANRFSKLIFLFSALLFQFLIIYYGFKLIRKHKEMIIHANDFNTLAGVVFLKILFSRRIRVVYDCHEFTPFVYSEWFGDIIGKIIAKLEIICVKYFDKILTVSTPIKEYLEVISNKTVKVIWNYPTKSLLPKFSKEEAREKLGLKKDDFILTYVGSLRLDVALLELIETAQLLKEKQLIPNLKILVVGDGPFYDQLKQKIDDYDLSGIVTITGRVSRDKAIHYLLAADLSYILFTIKGMNSKIGMPWKLFESLLCNTQVLTIDETYAAQFVKKHNAGFSVKTTNPSDIQEAIVEFHNKKEFSVTDLNQSFIWEVQEKNFIETYTDLL
ncbi:MAG: glycosyltransferase [Candidatus Heimdallarchaeota archaeon]|nr:glycosyltransferase [Candidatus Heimdallarchaeota archaeon]MBY8993318.1 glycosyltransferase [Candidatus Heimdallarchaeota archaeon]